MNPLSRHTLARAGVTATAVVATGAFFAAPAQADSVDGGTLPVTGVQVGVIGAVGVAVVALGAVLLVLARRRRIVTVAPDEESTDQ